MLNNTKNYILKKIITKFGFGFKISEFCMYMFKYIIDLICNFYEVFKKVEVYLDKLNTKAEIQKQLKLKSNYKTFKSF